MIFPRTPLAEKHPLGSFWKAPLGVSTPSIHSTFYRTQVAIFTCQGHIDQVYQTGVSDWVSQWVSEWQALPMIGLGSDKNKRYCFCSITFICEFNLFSGRTSLNISSLPLGPARTLWLPLRPENNHTPEVNEYKQRMNIKQRINVNVNV